MSKLQAKYIAKAEKQLLSFQKYSFTNYTRLWVLIENLQILVATEGLIQNRQEQLDLAFEIDEQLEALRSLRYTTDKDDEFARQVHHTLSMIARIKPYLAAKQVTPQLKNQRTSWFDFFKRFSFVINHA